MKRGVATIDRIMGQKIRFVRTSKNITLENMSMNLGMSPQQLWKYETGRNKISVSLLFDISNELGISPSNFFDSTDYSYNKCVGLTKNEREALCNLAKTIVKNRIKLTA